MKCNCQIMNNFRSFRSPVLINSQMKNLEFQQIIFDMVNWVGGVGKNLLRIQYSCSRTWQRDTKIMQKICESIMAPLQAVNIQLLIFIARQPNKVYQLDVNLSQLKQPENDLYISSVCWKGEKAYEIAIALWPYEDWYRKNPYH